MDGRTEAAYHFTQYLVATGNISSRSSAISREDLKTVFGDKYQPEYSVQCLEMKNLVPTLAKAGLLEKPSDDKSQVNFKWNRIHENGFVKGGFPEKPPARLTKPKQRIIISQRYTERHERQERPEGISADRCDICNVPLTKDTAEDHKTSELHMLITDYRKNKKKFEDTKHIFSVSRIGDDAKETQIGQIIKISCRVGVELDLGLRLTNILDEKDIYVEKVIALMPRDDVELYDISSIKVCPGQTILTSIKAEFSTKLAVIYPLVFVTRLAGVNIPRPFLVDIVIRVQSELMDELAPKTPYTRSLGPIVKLHNPAILPGNPSKLPSVNVDLTSPLRFKHFNIPPILLKFLNNGFKPSPGMTESEREKLKEVRDLLPKDSSSSPLTPNNYAQLLELLLFMEEHQMTRDIHHYDMHNAVLKRNQEGLWLTVPGVIDKRPSLLLNDVVWVNFVDDRTVAYEGYIQRINGSNVLLGLHDKFDEKYFGQKIEVQFQVNRSVLKSMHRALYVISAHGAQNLLFPQTESKPLHQPPLRPWFNKDISKNPEQMAAVRNIVYNSSQNSPYLVFGPPGTGKTVTLVETILQLWDPVKKTSRILVCAPSNAAADEITLRLLKVIQNSTLLKSNDDVSKHILRLCAFSRSLESMPAAISAAGITNHDPRDGSCFIPRIHVIMSYDIVISTFSNVSKLVLASLKPGHFTQIIMDEVGQAYEPEALIPLAGLATTENPMQFCCQVVMAGDPKQLGPILQSPVAAKFGLEKSMLERLMALPLYSKKPATNRYDPNVLTKLVLNYRSHPAILQVSNDLFYDGELKPVGDPNVINSICEWKGLKKKGFPVIFHGVQGIDEREGTSPSFFNRQEIEVVTDYLKTILADKIATPQEIGVVTPYNQQVKKVRKACELLKLPNIDVASVEQFQGQERKVIIISTVRSRFEFLNFDYMFQLGFLKNPKRFNVAVTRARALLVVVGNPKVLQHDICWRTLIGHCIQNGSYTGVPFEFEPLQEDKAQSVPARFQ